VVQRHDVLQDVTNARLDVGQAVDAEERVQELEDALDFAWQCEADTRRLAATDAAAAWAHIGALTQRLPKEEKIALQVRP